MAEVTTTGETFELGEVNKGVDADGDEAATGTDEAETSFGGDNLLDTSIPVPAGFNPDIVGESSKPTTDTLDVDAEKPTTSKLKLIIPKPITATKSRPRSKPRSKSDSDTFPNLGRDVGVMKRAYTQDKKDFLKKELGININKTAGNASKILFKKMEITMTEDRTKATGIKFENVQVMERQKNGKMAFLESSTTDEFKELIEEAKREYSTSLFGFVEKNLETVESDVPPQLVDNVRARSLERIDQDIETQTDEISKNSLLTRAKLREFRGSIYVPKSKEKLDNLEETERPYWKRLYDAEIAKEREARAAGNEEKAKQHHQKAILYEAIVDVVELKADQIRLELEQRPKWERVINIIKEEIGNNELSRFAKFKKWAKENLGGISVVAISVAGIITTIAMGARSVLVKGAKATNNFAKGLASLAKKVAPALGAILNVVAQILTLGAKGVEFLSRNLWILAIAIAYFLYDKFKNRKRER